MTPAGDPSRLPKLVLLLAIFGLIFANFWFAYGLSGLALTRYIFGVSGLWFLAAILADDITTSTHNPSIAATSPPAIGPLALPVDQALDTNPFSDPAPAPDVVPGPIPSSPNHSDKMPPDCTAFWLTVFSLVLFIKGPITTLYIFGGGFLLLFAVFLAVEHFSHSAKMARRTQHSDLLRDLLMDVFWLAVFGLVYFYKGLITSVCTFGGVYIFFFALDLAVKYLEPPRCRRRLSPGQAVDLNPASDANDVPVVVPDIIPDVVPAYDLDLGLHFDTPQEEAIHVPGAVQVMPLYMFRISHTPSPLTGPASHLHVVPIPHIMEPFVFDPDEPFLGYQHRDEASGKPCIIVGRMRFSKVERFLDEFFGKLSRKRVPVETEIRVVDHKTMTVVFMAQDKKRPPFGGAQLPWALAEEVEEADLTLDRLRVVLGKPVEKVEKVGEVVAVGV